MKVDASNVLEVEGSTLLDFGVVLDVLLLGLFGEDTEGLSGCIPHLSGC